MVYFFVHTLIFVRLYGITYLQFLVQAFAFVPLMYMCICTYYSLFKIGMLMFYSLTPRQTSSVNLLMICSYVFFIWFFHHSYLSVVHLCCQMNTIYMYILFFPRMVARYAPPISYNFLNLIRLGPNKETIFEKVFLWLFWSVNSILNIIFLV